MAHVEDEVGLRIPSFWQIVFGLVFGALFIALSVPLALVKLGALQGWGWLRTIGLSTAGFLNQAFGSSPDAQLLSFHSLWVTLLKALAVYLVALLLLSLRHVRFDLFAAGLIALVLGTAILNLFAWVVYLLLVILSFIVFLLRTIGEFLVFIFGTVFAFLGFIAAAVIRFLAFIVAELDQFFGFLFHSVWWIVALVGIVALVALALRYRSQVSTALLWLLRACGYVIAVFLFLKLFQLLAPVFAYLGALLGRFFAFLGALLAPVFRFVGMILSYVILVVVFLVVVFLVGFVIYGVGAWVIDLFRGAWTSGNRRRGVIIGALSIGTALALVLLETNLYHMAAFPYYPLQVATFAASYLHHASPIFDLLMALLIVGVATLGVLRNVPRLLKEPDWVEFQSAMVMAVLGILIGVVLMWISGLSDSN